MKKIANLKGAKTLGKKEQRSINGGFPGPLCGVICPSYCHCTGVHNDECAYNTGHPREGEWCFSL